MSETRKFNNVTSNSSNNNGGMMIMANNNIKTMETFAVSVKAVMETVYGLGYSFTLQEVVKKQGAHSNRSEGLEDLVFTSEFGYPMNRDRFKLDLNALIDRINQDGIKFDHITPHTFRHTFATRCIEKGMQPQVLKTILGHSKLSMTMDIYSHVLPKLKQMRCKKLQNCFRKYTL